MENKMYLVGSRLLGINDDNSDYDYVMYDNDIERPDFKNVHMEYKKHCYHYKKDYREAVMRFEIDDEGDYQFIYNAIDYKGGLLSESPFNYKDKWIEKLKNTDFNVRYFKGPHADKWMKRFYHVVYNLECLKQNTLDIDAEGLARVKKFYDMQATEEDYQNILEEVKALQ